MVVLAASIISKSGKVRPAASAVGPPKGLGMQLGKTQRTNQFLESLKAEGEVIVEDVRPSIGQSKPAAAPPTDPVTLTVEEKINVTLKRDGGISNFNVQGTLSLQILNQENGLIQVQIETSGNPAILFNTHPNINKELFSNENILGLKEPSRPFPANQSGDGVSLLRWRMQSADESILPLTINCWPSVSGNETYVNIEYETPAQIDLQNVVIFVRLPALREAPRIQQIDGEWRYDSRNSVLEWSTVLIDNSNRRKKKSKNLFTPQKSLRLVEENSLGLSDRRSFEFGGPIISRETIFYIEKLPRSN
ncbi:coatomer subunit delta-like isoform X2 [Solanum dulcamara]|uniref:coatomer subunit delta-like isoform X2 n=1 Tax=Solanum dulcamara TaxID=45834 RepID=UPI0024856752|nr:coatomer subunit delta-like isoform X2 [Solanum dulcamara]